MSSRRKRIRGNIREVIGTRKIAGRQYWLLERVGSPLRQSFLSFDPGFGIDGDFFLVQSFEVNANLLQRLRVLRRLRESYFPRVVAYQQQDGRVHLALTWQQGVPLNKYFDRIQRRRRPPVSPRHAVRLGFGLANAASVLSHRLQVAHGDVHPGNVIITSHPSHLRLMDFGNAWTLENARNRLEGDGQQRCYAAPELQAGNEIPVGFLSDQFSVSTVLYQLLTGSVPYAGLGGKIGRKEYANECVPLNPPSQAGYAVAMLSRKEMVLLDELVCRGMEREAKNRFPNRQAWLSHWSDLRWRLEQGS